MRDCDPSRKPEDTRQKRRKRERELLVLVALTLVAVGGGLVGIIYGSGALLGALPCLAGGVGAVLALYGLLLLAERWVQ